MNNPYSKSDYVLSFYKGRAGAKRANILPSYLPTVIVLIGIPGFTSLLPTFRRAIKSLSSS